MPLLRGKIKCQKTSTRQSGSAEIVDGPCAFGGIYFSLDGSTDVIFQIFNNAASPSGDRIDPGNPIDNGIKALGSSITFSYTVDPPVFCKDGLYIHIVSPNAASYGYVVTYDE